MEKETLYPRGEETAIETDRPGMNALETAEASIAEQVELLVMEVTRLEDKLSPVTEQNPVAERGANTETASPSFGTSSHLKFLSKTHDIVEATKDRLQRLRNRLEM